MSVAEAPDAAQVLAAARRLHPHLRRTSLAGADSLAAAAGAEVLLKLENQQRTGAFKVRGALNAVSALPAAVRARGLVTASAGNHGLGLALAARLTGCTATVFVPAGAAATKRRRIARLGAELRIVEGGYDDAHAAGERHAASVGAGYVHAFHDPLVVAGQGTVGLEILLERPDVRTLLVPVGGGGLIGGIGIIARALAPAARIVGVQTPATGAMHASLAAGRPVSVPSAPTLCDGLAGDVDERSLALAHEVVDEILLVEEIAVRRAIRSLYVEEGIVAEGSAAVVVAALLIGALAGHQAPIAAVISGGNLDAPLLAEILGDAV